MNWHVRLRRCAPAPCLFKGRLLKGHLLARAASGLLLLLAAVSCGDSQQPASREPPGDARSAYASKTVPASGRIDARLLRELSASLRSSQFSPEVEALLSGERQAAREDANWPTLTYLVGEAQRRRGQTERSRATFRELTLWAISGHQAGPYGDTLGGSGLVAVGLWRWLQILEQRAIERPEAVKGEVEEALKAAAALGGTRLYSGMVRSGLLPALPLLEEDVARRLAHIAWKSKRPEAAALFLDFLAINSSSKLDATDEEILAHVRSLVTSERLKLFRARRLLALVKTADQKDQAARTLEMLWEDQGAPADVRSEAGYEWANFNRRSRQLRSRLVEVLTSAFKLAGEGGPIAERALHLRGKVYNLEGQGRDINAFRADMNAQLARFPLGRLADDALFQLATDYLFEPDVSNALSHFEKLRGFEGPNKYQDSAYFLAALALVGRKGEGDLAAADRLLEEYVKRYPDGVFRLRCLFWSGRIAEERNDAERARALFRQVVEEAPYDYYGLRARMHLEDGAGARRKDLPAADSRTRAELHEAYRRSRVDTQAAAPSPYHARLRSAAGSGLYGELLKVEQELAERLDDVSLDRLDERGLLPAAALLLALRQDALAARDSELTADNRLRLAGVLGQEVRDWPVAIEMTAVSGGGPQQRLTELQKDPRYLATVYPSADRLKTLEKPLALATWPIDGSPGLSESLMYAVMRHESRFYPGAISAVGAVGLFQFMPATFADLDKSWKLLQKIGVRSNVEYLLDPERSTMLWARWMKSEFSLTHRSDIAMALMKHHGGSIRSWIAYWERLGAKGDLEFRVETARFNETRNFVRLVLQDTVIVDAAGFFEGRP